LKKNFLFYFYLLANYLVFTYRQTGRAQLYEIQKNQSVELATVFIIEGYLKMKTFLLISFRQKLNVVRLVHQANI
jgi:hypothetical protein